VKDFVALKFAGSSQNTALYSFSVKAFFGLSLFCNVIIYMHWKLINGNDERILENLEFICLKVKNFGL
jgi:hypothetical protein